MIDLAELSESLILVFGPLVIHWAIPLLFALGIIAAIVAPITVLFTPRKGPQR
jgi:hypothetical protein